MEGTKAAMLAVQAIGDLAQQGVDVQKTSEKFGDALAKINAAAAVASIDVLSRGKDLVQAAGQEFMTMLVSRSLLGPDPGPTSQLDLLVDVLRVQKKLQGAYVLLVAAVRRDLGIEGSGDEEVSNALSVDLDALERHTRQTIEALMR